MKEDIKIKGRVLGKLFWIGLILWMALIFGMSAQTGESSAKMSSPVARRVAELIIPGFDAKDAKTQEEIELKVEFFIRKGAHFTEYAILGILAFLVLQQYLSVGAASALIAWVFSSIYAASDEIHQNFVSERAMQFRDVCIDSAGAFTGILIMLLIIWLIYRFVRKRADLLKN